MPSAVSTERYYNLRGVFLVINGQRIEGFGDTDAVTFEPADDAIKDAISADGMPVVNETNDFRCYATITVMENSPAARQLSDLNAAQRTTGILGTPPVPYTFKMIDSNSGDRIQEDSVYFMNNPGPSKGKEAGTREFKIFLPFGLMPLNYGLAETTLI